MITCWLYLVNDVVLFISLRSRRNNERIGVIANERRRVVDGQARLILSARRR